MSVATFPPASLSGQLNELRRERKMRERVYPLLIAKRTLQERDALFQNNALDGAIATLARLEAARANGEPGRKELVEALRSAAEALRASSDAVEPHAVAERIEALLEKVPA